MVLNKYFHPQRKAWIRTKARSKPPKANTKSCSSMSVILQAPTDWVLSMALWAGTYISGSGSAHCLQLSLADVLHSYHLQHLEVSIPWLYLQFYAFRLYVATHCLASQPFLWSLNLSLCDSPGPCIPTKPLSHGWPQDLQPAQVVPTPILNYLPTECLTSWD